MSPTASHNVCGIEAPRVFDIRSLSLVSVLMK
jgi:hypothetical protein